MGFAAWRLIPRPDLAEPRGGPPWRQSLEELESTLARQLVAHADAHGGRYPDDTTALIPQLLEAAPDPAWRKRAWEWRPGWYAALPLAWAATLLWVIVVLWRSRRRAVGRIAAVVSGAAIGLIGSLWWVTATPQPSYVYLDWLRVLPGLEEPVPRPVPILWATAECPAEARRGAIWLRDGTRWRVLPHDPSSPFGLSLVEAAARRPKADVDASLAEAREGDADAFLALAVRREAVAADLFAEPSHRGVKLRIALWGLHLLRDERAGGAALQALASADAETQAYAATLLRYTRPKGATQALMPLLGAEAPDVRAAAWGSLGCDGDPTALAHLREALAAASTNGPPVVAREVLWGALARMGTDEALTALLAEMERPHPNPFSRNRRILRIMAQAGAAAVPALAPFLESRSPEEREGARAALADTGCDAACEPLLAAADIGYWAPLAELARRNPRVRARLFELGMARMGPRDDSASHRVAASALGACGLDAAVEPLLGLLKEGGQVRYDAARSLAQLRASAAVEPLAAMLEDPDRHVRDLAARLLLQIGDARAMPALRRAASLDRRDNGSVPAALAVAQRLGAARRYREKRGTAEGRSTAGEQKE